MAECPVTDTGQILMHATNVGQFIKLWDHQDPDPGWIVVHPPVARRIRIGPRWRSTSPISRNVERQVPRPTPPHEHLVEFLQLVLREVAGEHRGAGWWAFRVLAVPTRGRLSSC